MLTARGVELIGGSCGEGCGGGGVCTGGWYRMGVAMEATRFGAWSVRRSLADLRFFKLGKGCLGKSRSISSMVDAARMHWCIFRPVQVIVMLGISE